MPGGRPHKIRPFDARHRFGVDLTVDAETLATVYLAVIEERLVRHDDAPMRHALERTCEVLTPGRDLQAVERASSMGTFDEIKVSDAMGVPRGGNIPTWSLMFAGGIMDLDLLPYPLAVLYKNGTERLVFSNLDHLERRGLRVKRFVDEVLRPRVGSGDHRKAYGVPTLGIDPEALRKCVERNAKAGNDGMALERAITHMVAKDPSNWDLTPIVKRAIQGNDPRVLRNILDDPALRLPQMLAAEWRECVKRSWPRAVAV
jgi:hypothetical protein